MSENELKKLLALPEYSWVKEDLLPAYYVLSKMGFGLGNGYQFIPTSEENLLINLKTKRALSELREVEQIFANWVGREREEAVYNTGTRGYSGHDYGHNKHHSGNEHEIRITITGPLLNIGKERFKMIKRDLKLDFEIKTIYDLLFFKYLLSNVNVKALEDTGLISIITKDEMWESWSESAAHSAKSLVRKLISCNKAFLSDAVIGTMASKLMGDREIFYKFMDSIPERYKVVEHDFNSSSCSLHYKYAIPSEVWNKIRAKIDGIDYVSIIKPSLSKLEEEYGDILNEIKFLELLKQEKVDANNRMKIGDYERFSDVIKRLTIEGFIKIAPTEDIILLVEGRTIVTRKNSLMGEINDMILRWLNEKVEPEPKIKPITETGKKHGEDSGKDVIMIGTDDSTVQCGLLGLIDGKKAYLDLHRPHVITTLGLQGSGKSYGAGAILEMAIKSIPGISDLRKPFSCIVFHYSKEEKRIPEWIGLSQNNSDSRQIELLKKYGATPDCIDNDEIKIFVPPFDTVYNARVRDFSPLKVNKLLLSPSKLGGDDWKRILGFGKDSQQMYGEELNLIFIDLREKSDNKYDVETIRYELDASDLNSNQKKFAKLRIRHIEKWLDEECEPFTNNCKPGNLNIIDLRDPLLESNRAAIILQTLFSLVKERPSDEICIIAIDEAHLFFKKADLSAEIIEFVRLLRKDYKVYMLLISQKPRDFHEDIIGLSDILICHKTTDQADLDFLTKHQPGFRGLENDIRDLEKAKGEAFIYAAESTNNYLKKARKIVIRPKVTEDKGRTVTVE